MEFYILIGLIIIVEIVIILYFKPLPKKEQITAITPKPEPQKAVIDQSPQQEKEELEIEQIDRLIRAVEEEENLPRKQASRKSDFT